MKDLKLLQRHFLFLILILFLSYKSDNFTFKVLFWAILYYIKVKENHNTFMVSCEKTKMISFTSSIMKNMAVYTVQFRFLVKLTCCIAFATIL